MKAFISILLLSLLVSHPSIKNDSSNPDELKIAQVMRKAVKNADSTLLKSTLLANWREYLKISTIDLDVELQPLLLIKFDEDMAFRKQLKTIIDWQSNWLQKETEHFIYYYRWDQPPPELILEILEIHFKALAKLFAIEIPEKIPFRYDLTAEHSTVFPFQDLRGGIVSSQLFDLEKSALAIFYFINSEPPSILEPLVRIYGSYFQNPSTSEAYYEHSLREIKKKKYTSALNLYRQDDISNFTSPDWFSSYAFVYGLNQQFGPEKLAQFLSNVNCQKPETEFQNTFQEIFGISLPEFESRYQQSDALIKM